MGLHSIIEPAGTLLTGWGLVPDADCTKADVRNKGEGARPAPAEDGDRTPVAAPQSKWESTERELGEVG